MPPPGSLSLWYATPAETWTDALPIGNGQFGAMIFGRVAHERIQLNEKSLWSGRPQDSDSSAGPAALGEIRKLLFAGDYEKAQSLAQKFLATKVGSAHGHGATVAYGSYQTLGDLLIELDHPPDSLIDYRRDLDLTSATAATTWRDGPVTHTREIFASHPDRCLVVRLCADQPGQISVKLKLTRAERFKTESTAPD